MVLVGTVAEEMFSVRLHGRQEKPPGEGDSGPERHVAGQYAVVDRDDGGVTRTETREVAAENVKRDDDEVTDSQSALKEPGRGDDRAFTCPTVGRRLVHDSLISAIGTGVWKTGG